MNDTLKPNSRRWLRIGAVAAPLSLVSALGIGAVWAQRGPTSARVTITAPAVTTTDETSALGPAATTTTSVATATTVPTGPRRHPAPAVTRPPVGITRPTSSNPTGSTTTVVAPTIPAAGTNLDQPGLYLVDADTGSVSSVLRHYRFETVSFSPDGRHLVFTGRDGDGPADGSVPTRMWTVGADGSDVSQISNDTPNPENPSWSPNGRWIAYYASPVDAHGDQALYLLDTATHIHRLLASVDQARFPLEWSPDSARIAMASPNHGTITVIDPVSGAKTEAPVPPLPDTGKGPNPVNEISWSKDGSQLIASYLSGPVALADASGNGLRPLNTEARYARASPTAAVVSEWINASAYVQPLDGGPARLLAPGFDPLDWSHDGQFIAGETAGNTVVAIDATTGRIRQLIHENHLGASPAGWSPTTHAMAVIIEDVSVRRY